MCGRAGDKAEKTRTNWRREAGLLAAPVTPGPEIQRPQVVAKVKKIIKKPVVPAEVAPEGVKKFLLVNHLCAGDVLVSTAAIESLAAQYPDRFWIGVDAKDNSQSDDNNPHVRVLGRDDPEVTVVDWQYPLIQRSNRARFISWTLTPRLWAMLWMCLFWSPA